MGNRCNMHVHPSVMQGIIEKKSRFGGINVDVSSSCDRRHVVICSGRELVGSGWLSGESAGWVVIPSCALGQGTFNTILRYPWTAMHLLVTDSPSVNTDIKHYYLHFTFDIHRIVLICYIDLQRTILVHYVSVLGGDKGTSGWESNRSVSNCLLLLISNTAMICP